MTPILAISGFSNSGKTTLLERLLPKLTDQGLRVAVAKHDVHGLAENEYGKDSQRLRLAGATDVLLIGPPEDNDRLQEAIEKFASTGRFDLVLCEGFKSTTLPKIAVYRKASGSPPLDAEKHKPIIARVGDQITNDNLPFFRFDDIGGIEEFILNFRKQNNE